MHANKRQNWINTTIGEVLTFQRGFDITKKQQETGPHPVISSSGINSFHSSFKVNGPGVVIGRKGSLGTVFFIEKNYWPHDTTLWVKDFHGNDPKFAYYFLQIMHFEQYDCGASNPSLNRNHIHKIPVLYPNLPTQRKIAAILSAYDDLIENNIRRIKILEEMAQALYREWFVNFRFPGHEKVTMVDSPLGEIPEGWEAKRVSDAITINPKMKVPKEGEKPFIAMDNLSTNSMIIDGFNYKTGNSGSKFKNKDTLFARITPCLENGKTGFVQILPANDAVAIGSTEFIVLRSKTIIPELVYLIARSEGFRDHAIKSMSGATGRQRVRENCFDNFLTAQPDNKILEKFQVIISPIFKNIHYLACKNANLRRTRDLLLPKLITGELDVDAQDIKTEGMTF